MLVLFVHIFSRDEEAHPLRHPALKYRAKVTPPLRGDPERWKPAIPPVEIGGGRGWGGRLEAAGAGRPPVQGFYWFFGEGQLLLNEFLECILPPANRCEPEPLREQTSHCRVSGPRGRLPELSSANWLDLDVSEPRQIQSHSSELHPGCRPSIGHVIKAVCALPGDLVNPPCKVGGVGRDRHLVYNSF